MSSINHQWQNLLLLFGFKPFTLTLKAQYSTDCAIKITILFTFHVCCTVKPAPVFQYAIIPVVKSHIQQISALQGDHYYTCDFTITPEDKSLLYYVEWKLHDGWSGTKMLFSAIETRDDENAFTQATTLLSAHLKAKGVEKMGFTVRFLSC